LNPIESRLNLLKDANIFSLRYLYRSGVGIVARNEAQFMYQARGVGRVLVGWLIQLKWRS